MSRELPSTHKIEAQFLGPHEQPYHWNWPFKYFTPDELRCRCCQCLLYNPDALVKLENLRLIWGEPLPVSSAFRCKTHNQNVRGAPASLHLEGRAFDIPMIGHRQTVFIRTAELAGFTGIGRYGTFIHVDNGARRTW